MAVILNIETSGSSCSVALTSDGMVLAHYEDFNGRNHAAMLSGFIKRALDRGAGLGLKPEAIAVSMGPGSYTGLRIGLSEAKGLAYGLNIPLIGIDTLQIMAVSVMFRHDIDENTLLMPMVDARRMEVFTAIYNNALSAILPPAPMILTEPGEIATIAEKCTGSRLLYFGSGALKAKELLEPAVNCEFIDGIEPLAVDMMALADRAFAKGDFVDTAYSTPRYLKDFQASTPKNRI